MPGVGSFLTRIGHRARGIAAPSRIGPDEPADQGELALERALTEAERRIIDRCRPYSMTSAPRLLSLIDSVRHLVGGDVPGDFAECGVWRGGSVLAMILALQELGVDDREIHLYDTFEGMTQPGERDVSPFDRPALETWKEAEAMDSKAWNYLFDDATFNEAAVRKLLLDTGYPECRLHFHRGDVMQSIPARAPELLALVRLDTDWYESTRHEMEHLYPRLTRGGILIIDDYGHWHGSRQAVDDYFGERPPFLHRIDYTARLAIKL